MRQRKDTRTAHNHPLYLLCPDLLRAVGETSYGLRVGFIEFDIVFTISLLFVYLYLRCKVWACSVNQIKIIL